MLKCKNFRIIYNETAIKIFFKLGSCKEERKFTERFNCSISLPNLTKISLMSSG